ncbi:uncharacterized protein TNCV_4996861 [Trichonephila clavipes]|nr:uncharacterized protein TNCV_4996861 [Trichonephila clavipes]
MWERNIEKLFDEARQNMRKQHKTWETYYNRKRREMNIKVNDLVLVQTHFISAAGRRVVGKFMPKFEGPYRVLEVRNNNLIIRKKGRRGSQLILTKCECTIQDSSTQLDLIVMIRLYMKERGRVGRTWENPKALGKPRVMRVRVLNQGSEYGDQKRPTPVPPPRGIKKTVPASITSRNHKYRRSNNPSQGPESIPSTSHQLDIRQCNPHTEKSRQGARVQNDRGRETRTTPSKGRSTAEGRPVRSRQTTGVRPCPYYLRSRLKQPEGEYQRSTGINSLPQNSLRRRSLSMAALDGDPADMSE